MAVAITDMNSKASEKVASGSSSSEVLLDDLPCDFNDFSNDSEDDGMCTNSVTFRCHSLIEIMLPMQVV